MTTVMNCDKTGSFKNLQIKNYDEVSDPKRGLALRCRQRITALTFTKC